MVCNENNYKIVVSFLGDFMKMHAATTMTELKCVCVFLIYIFV